MKNLIFFAVLLTTSQTLYASETVSFPENFQWCVATAAHQIEGGNTQSDHYVWETSAPDRVISKEIIPNPGADQILASAAGAFSTKTISCPVIFRDQDPDPKRRHTYIFATNDPSKISICEYSGEAIDHWNLYEKDIQLLKDLNIKQYRLSVEWAKIEPTKGKFNEDALQHYAHELELLKAAGITPQITLFHFTMPQWLRSEGGWESPKSPAYFSQFTKKVYERLGKYSDIWYTFNEPMVHITAGYVAGVLPPGEKNSPKFPMVLGNLLRAHAVSYWALHHAAAAQKRSIRVGMAHHLRIFDPATPPSSILNPSAFLEHQIEQLGSDIADQVWNWLIFDAIETGRLGVDLGWAQPVLSKFKITVPSYLNFKPMNIAFLKGTQDFLGLNYYTRDTIKLDVSKLGSGSLTDVLSPIVNPDALAKDRVTDMKWEIYPDGMLRILKALHDRGSRYSKMQRSVIISENGIADKSDSKRKNFLEAHLVAVAQAIKSGIPVEGYCHWTLIDNFEWNSGYYPQFGFYSVDLNTQERKLRGSGRWFSKVTSTGQFVTSSDNPFLSQ